MKRKTLIFYTIITILAFTIQLVNLLINLNK